MTANYAPMKFRSEVNSPPTPAAPLIARISQLEQELEYSRKREGQLEEKCNQIIEQLESVKVRVFGHDEKTPLTAFFPQPGVNVE